MKRERKATESTVKKQKLDQLSIKKKGERKGTESMVKNLDQLSTEQREAYDMAIDGKNIFITGIAGAGKSFLLKKIIEAIGYKNGVYVTGSTGIAAWNIEGTTLHNFAGLGLAEGPIDKLLENAKKNKMVYSKWIGCNTLIIDEISMVSYEFFEILEEIARLIRKKSAVFGGIQVILCGDFLQIPPVSRKSEVTKFCFESSKWTSCISKTFYLKKSFRQADDIFANMLNEIRLGMVSEKTKTTLGTCVDKTFDFKPTILFSRNEEVDSVNKREIALIKENEVFFNSVDWAMNDSFLKQLNESCKAPAKLVLKMGCQVMLLKNLEVGNGLVNGSRGVVVGFDEITRGPIVDFNGYKKTLEQATFSIGLQDNVFAKRIQYPLVLAYSFTIHKSQGTTLESVEVNIAGCFEFGQVYVALSRCKTLEGLSIKGLNVDRIKASPKAIKFYKDLEK